MHLTKLPQHRVGMRTWKSLEPQDTLYGEGSEARALSKDCSANCVTSRGRVETSHNPSYLPYILNITSAHKAKHNIARQHLHQSSFFFSPGISEIEILHLHLCSTSSLTTLLRFKVFNLVNVYCYREKSLQTNFFNIWSS